MCVSEQFMIVDVRSPIFTETHAHNFITVNCVTKMLDSVVDNTHEFGEIHHDHN